MDNALLQSLPDFLATLGLDEAPMGLYYTDELSFTVPFGMFTPMLNRCPESFLMTETYATVRKKIARSKKAWGEQDPEADGNAG
jgi:hypothetical protein